MEALGLNPVGIILHAINFLILLYLLQRFLYKPVVSMLDQRAATIRESVEAAERTRQELVRADQERTDALREARQQAEQIVTQALQESERIRGEARQTAQEEAQRIISRAQQEATAERQQVMQELRAEVADLAVLAAERVIRKNLDDPTHRALVEEFLAGGNGLARGDGMER
jgi:F-type H+-transporting ATPase subunit b